MIRAAALLLAMAFALGSCTAPEMEVEAYAEGGSVAFRVAPDQLRDANCFFYFHIIDAQGKVMWEVWSDRVSGPPEDCPRTFPLRYGVTPPKGVRTTIAPSPLVPGQLYVIDGDVIGRMTGAFRIGPDGTVERLDPNDPAARAALEIYGHTSMNAADANTADPGINATAN